MFINEYLLSKINKGDKVKDIAKSLDITPAMVGQYKLDRGYNPSLSVAKKIYLMDNVVLHPYSEDSLKYEIEKDN
jgi:predicted transcriptional regulator